MPELSIVNLLGWSLQAGLLIAAAALAARLLPVDSPSVRHAWWRAVLIVSLALPVLQGWHPAPTGAISTFDTSALTTPIADPAAVDARGVAPSPLRAMVGSFERLALVAILCGVAVRLTWLAAGLAHLRRLRRVGRFAALADIDADLQTLVPAGTEIKYVEAVGQPVTFGIRRPVVILPEVMRALPPAVQRAVIAHELWHVRRHDWGWLVTEEILRGVLWFHPAIWWLISRIQTSREEVVDELTVLVTSSRRGYLEALLAFADQPPLFAAAPFARRRHLYHRMLLLSREAVMSSRRIVASCAGMVLVLLMAGWYGVSAFPLSVAPAAGVQQPQPRDPRPSDVRPATSRERALQKVITEPQADPSAFEELAKLQEARGAVSEAEATLVALNEAQPTLVAARQKLAAFYHRMGQFDRTVATLEKAASLDPTNPESHHIVATFYFDKVSKDPSLTPTEQVTYIHAGLAAEDRALAVRPEYVEAMIYKNILLRMEAKLEGDPARRAALLTEANALRSQAMVFQPKNPPPPPPAAGGPGPHPGMPPPPPPPPPPDDATSPTGATPVRVGSQIMTPTKIVDVKPVYPDAARDAGLQGVVIIEAVIDERGSVREARVLRSIPLLDQAALDAVRQWKYRPTVLNGQAVPVVMTMTINFAQP